MQRSHFVSYIRRCHGFLAFSTQLECVYLILPYIRSNNQWCLRNNIKAKSCSYQWICTYNHHVYKHSQWKPMISREYWHFPLIHTRDIKNVLSHCHLGLKFALYIELYGYWLTDESGTCQHIFEAIQMKAALLFNGQMFVCSSDHIGDARARVTRYICDKICIALRIIAVERI